MTTHYSIFSKPRNFSLTVSFVYYSQFSLSLNSMKTTFVHIQLASLLHNLKKIIKYLHYVQCPITTKTRHLCAEIQFG